MLGCSATRLVARRAVRKRVWGIWVFEGIADSSPSAPVYVR